MKRNRLSGRISPLLSPIAELDTSRGFQPTTLFRKEPRQKCRTRFSSSSGRKSQALSKPNQQPISTHLSHNKYSKYILNMYWEIFCLLLKLKQKSEMKTMSKGSSLWRLIRSCFWNLSWDRNTWMEVLYYWWLYYSSLLLCFRLMAAWTLSELHTQSVEKWGEHHNLTGPGLILRWKRLKLRVMCFFLFVFCDPQSLKLGIGNTEKSSQVKAGNHAQTHAAYIYGVTLNLFNSLHYLHMPPPTHTAIRLPFVSGERQQDRFTTSRLFR